MTFKAQPMEIQLADSKDSLGSHVLTVDPFPGLEIILDGQPYLVMERRNRYRFQLNRYELDRIILTVVAIANDAEKFWMDGQWLIGNIACRYNARSPLIRCAVNPQGPCTQCADFKHLESL